jgi:hypothetical protein
LAASVWHDLDDAAARLAASCGASRSKLDRLLRWFRLAAINRGSMLAEDDAPPAYVTGRISTTIGEPKTALAAASEVAGTGVSPIVSLGCNQSRNGAGGGRCSAGDWPAGRLSRAVRCR